MTTILGLVTPQYVLMASDSQVTQGNLKLPVSYKKIQCHENFIVGSSGSLGLCQNLTKITLRTIRQELASSDKNISIGVDEFSKTLSEINFSLPIKYNEFSSSDFLVGGMSEVPKLYCVSSDGSLMSIDKYFAIGSGSPLAFSLLGTSYDAKDSLQTAAGKIYLIMKEITKSDIFTDDKIEIYSCDNAGKINELALNVVKETKPNGN